MRFAATGAAGGPSLRAADILGPRQFIPGVVDDLVGNELRRGVGTETGNLLGKNHEDKQQKRFEHQGSAHSAIGENTMGRFAGQARAGA